MRGHTYRIVDPEVARRVTRTVLITHCYDVTWTGSRGVAIRRRSWVPRRPRIKLTMSIIDLGQGLCLRVEDDGWHDIEGTTNSLFRALKDAGQNRVSTSKSTAGVAAGGSSVPSSQGVGLDDSLGEV